MPKNKRYRGKARRAYPPNVTDNTLVEERSILKDYERTRNEVERHQFESSLGTNEPEIRFDYSDNVFSLRGNWSSRVKVIKLFLPIMVRKNKCKKFEEMINNAFNDTFLV